MESLHVYEGIFFLKHSETLFCVYIILCIFRNILYRPGNLFFKSMSVHHAVLLITNYTGKSLQASEWTNNSSESSNAVFINRENDFISVCIPFTLKYHGTVRWQSQRKVLPYFMILVFNIIQQLIVSFVHYTGNGYTHYFSEAGDFLLQVSKKRFTNCNYRNQILIIINCFGTRF